MKVNVKPVVLAAVLVTSALSVFAHAGGPGPEGRDGRHGMHRMDPERQARMHERMQEHMAQRAAELKAQLKLSPEQEGSWNAYVGAMKPAAPPAAAQRADDAKLSTPERLDRMREMRRQRDAEFDKRDAATRSFYAGLNAEQKKIFDDNTGRRPSEGRRHGPR